MDYICYDGIAIVVLTQIIGFALGYQSMSVKTNLVVIVLLMVSAFMYTSLLYGIALLMKSEGAWSGMATIVGTLVGFLGGIYLPIGSVSQGVATFMKCTPAIYVAAMFRSSMTKDSMELLLKDLNTEVLEKMQLELGNTIEIFGVKLSISIQAISIFLLGVLFLGISIFVLQKKKLKDR